MGMEMTMVAIGDDCDGDGDGVLMIGNMCLGNELTSLEVLRDYEGRHLSVINLGISSPVAITITITISIPFR